MWIAWYGTSDRIQLLKRIDACERLAELSVDEGPFRCGDLPAKTREYLQAVLELGVWSQWENCRVELLSSLEGVE